MENLDKFSETFYGFLEEMLAQFWKEFNQNFLKYLENVKKRYLESVKKRYVYLGENAREIMELI